MHDDSTQPESDFRLVLYERYLSSFKNRSSPLDAGFSSAQAAWWRARMLPLFADLDEDSRILELGAGSGVFLNFLQSQGYQNTVGVDISEEQVQAAAQTGLPMHCVDASNFLLSSDSSYEVVVCIDFLEHLTKNELVELIPLVYRALLPGGRLVIQTANAAGLLPHQVMYGDLTHMTFFTEESISQLLSRFGFVEIRSQETGPVAKNLVGVVRWLLWRVVRFAAQVVRLIEAGKHQEVWTENLICSAQKPSGDVASSDPS